MEGIPMESPARLKAEQEGWQPRIVAILCNWCSYAGADLAGVSRLQYPPSIRIVRVMCTGRMNPSLVIRALQQGADGVLVAGCHPGDCHYVKGNFYARRRFAILTDLFNLIGLDKDRFMMSWISASEGGRFAEFVTELTDRVRRLGPQQELRRPGT